MRNQSGQLSYKKITGFSRQCLSIVLAVALMLFAAPVFSGVCWGMDTENELIRQAVQPVVVLSGKGIIGDTYSADSIVDEKSYTLDELKAIANADANAAPNNRYLYSAYNTYDNATIYLGEGVRVDTLLARAGASNQTIETNIIAINAPDNYSVKYDPAKATVGEINNANRTQGFGVTRYYYPKLKASGTGNAENVAEVPTILAWAQGGKKGVTEVPATVTEFEDKVESMTGQIALNDYNNPLFNGNVTEILVGDRVPETAITIDGRARTRSAMLMMKRADRSYTYKNSTGIDVIDYVRGVPIGILLNAYDQNDIVQFSTAGSNVKCGLSITLGELENGNYILAYEKGTSSDDLQAIYSTADDSVHGYFTLYGDDAEPLESIDRITIKPAIDFTASSYKHITNGGLSGQEGPYNIEAITGSILTIEGPGVSSKAELPLNELETQNAGAYRGIYTDTRNETNWTMQYEGIRLSYILNGMTSGAHSIHMTEYVNTVLLLDRARQTIAGFTLDEISAAETAGKPILIAYGTGMVDDTAAAPLVFDNADGYDAVLDNGDGPIKLVYDKTVFTADPNSDYKQFKNVAYIYVETAAAGPNPGVEPTVPGQYDLIIDGAVSSPVYYTADQLKNEAGAAKVVTSYYWLNSYGTTGTDSFEGIYLEDLLDNAGLTSSARSITVTAGDGYHRSFNLDSNDLGVYWADIQGNKIMLAWKQNGSPCNLKLVVGQKNNEHINKPNWVDDIAEITVNNYFVTPGEGPPGSYEEQKQETVPLTPAVTLTPTVIEGTATLSISAADILKVLENIKSENQENKTSKAVVEINAVSGKANGEVNKAQVTLVAEAIKALIKEDNVTAAIKTDLGQIVLPPQVLKELAANSTQPLVIDIAISNDSGLDEQTREQIGTRPIVNISISNGTQNVSSLGGNQIKAGIAYNAQSDERQSQLLVYYINDQGKSVPVKLSVFDSSNKQMLFGTAHLSLYAVGYNLVSFDDIQSHWAKDNIEFLAAREILKGKAAGVFDPNGKVTRAEYVTMLANSVDGITVTGAKDAGFADVPAGKWYTGYVNWAVAHDIISGCGNGRFAPDDAVTREQMAVMTDKFVQAMQFNLDTVNEKTAFSDQSSINSWSAASVTSMQQLGIISGKPDGAFVPQGTTTRAEAATVIKGYIDALLK